MKCRFSINGELNPYSPNLCIDAAGQYRPLSEFAFQYTYFYVFFLKKLTGSLLELKEESPRSKPLPAVEFAKDSLAAPNESVEVYGESMNAGQPREIRGRDCLNSWSQKRFGSQLARS